MSTRSTCTQFLQAGIASLLLAFAAVTLAAQETSPPPAQKPGPEPQNQEVLRAYQQVQDQLHAVQSNLERNQQDAQDIAARNVKALGDKLNSIEQTVGSQRAAELQTLQSSNRFMLIITGALVLLGVVIVFFAYMQWRAMHQLTEAALGLQVQQQLGGVRSPTFIEAHEPRLLGVIDRLEKRIRELETANHLPLPSTEPGQVTNGNGTSENGTHTAITAGGASTSQATLLINKGQSLMSLAKYDDAVKCFDDALAMEPGNTEALIKKGTALEKQEKLNEAVACYDRAIAADNTVTLAYLYKGGVFNRMERYNEALECYEKALKTQEKSHAA